MSLFRTLMQKFPVLILAVALIPFNAGAQTPNFSRIPEINEDVILRLVESSKSYGEYVSRLVQMFPPKAHVMFWSSDRGVAATAATSPQYFIMVDGATIAIAPDRFSEIVINHGEYNTVIHVVTNDQGKPLLNQFRFTGGASVAKTPKEHHLSSELARTIGLQGLVQKSGGYETISCSGCHLGKRRRLFEADNHHRVFGIDKNWAFRDPKRRREIEEILAKKLKEFDIPENRANPVYSWIFNQPQVVKRGYLKGEDLFTEGRAFRQMFLDSANEMLGDLKALETWRTFAEAFAFAVTGDPRLEEQLKRTPALSHLSIEQERARVERLQAEKNLEHIRHRNAASMAYILAGSDRDKFNQIKNEEILLLNRHSIETIGPAILQMLVSDEEWRSLQASEKKKKVRLSELDVANLGELKRIVNAPDVLEHIRRRVNTHIVLKGIVGSDREAMARLSTSIGVTAEARGRGVDIIENYARAISRNGLIERHLAEATDPASTFLVEGDLEKVYRDNPGLRTQMSDLAFFETEARRILNDETRVSALMQFLKGDLRTVQAARAEIIHKLVRTEPSLGRVVVSGMSVTGMVTAAIAAQSGFKVDGFDLRPGFTRNVQWANRQAMVDELASIDPSLADKFLLKISELNRGYVLQTPDGVRVGEDKPLSHTVPDPRNIPQNGRDVLLQKPGGIVETKVYEELMLDFVNNHPNIRRHIGTIEIGDVDPQTGKYMVTLKEKQADGTFVATESFRPELLVVSEGAGSETRKQLKIKTVDASPSRQHVAAIIEMKHPTGQLVRRYRNESAGKMIGITMRAETADGVWLISDIDDTILSKDGPERQIAIDNEVRRIAAGNLGLSPESLATVKVRGAIANMPITPFTMQGRFATATTAGTNVVLVADAGGAHHWSAGGGATIGAVSHPERVKKLIAKRLSGGSDKETIIEYARGATADTHAWGEFSTFDYYDRMTQAEGIRAYRLAVRAYYQNLVESPKAALEIMFPQGRKTENVNQLMDVFEADLTSGNLKKTIEAAKEKTVQVKIAQGAKGRACINLFQ